MLIRLILFLAVASWSIASWAQGADIVSERSVFTLHSKLTLLTPTPHIVSRSLAALCVSPPLSHHLAGEVARAGPHANVQVNLYVSDKAVGSMALSKRRFPEGTVVLKEKLSPDGAVVAVGGMIKRSFGFDREHNDWQYFYAEKAGAFSKGRLSNCIECHTKAKLADFVYTIRKPGS